MVERFEVVWLLMFYVLEVEKRVGKNNVAPQPVSKGLNSLRS